QDVELPAHGRLFREERPRGVDCHGEDIGDAALAVLHLQRLRVVAGAVAGGAGRVDAGQEQQLHRYEALALAGLAAALPHVEREAAGAVAARAGHARRREDAPHLIEQARVRGQVRARGAADRALVDLHQAADPVEPARDDTANGGRLRGVEEPRAFVAALITALGRLL